MSVEQTSEWKEEPSKCSGGSDDALVNTCDDGDGSQDASDSGDEAHDIMVLALRSQIREALQDEHRQEVAKVKHMYEAELEELRADILTLQHFETKQREREQVCRRCCDDITGYKLEFMEVLLCRGWKHSTCLNVPMDQEAPASAPR